MFSWMTRICFDVTMMAAVFLYIHALPFIVARILFFTPFTRFLIRRRSIIHCLSCEVISFHKTGSRAVTTRLRSLQQPTHHRPLDVMNDATLRCLMRTSIIEPVRYTGLEIFYAMATKVYAEKITSPSWKLNFQPKIRKQISSVIKWPKFNITELGRNLVQRPDLANFPSKMF